jgi:hypothetical protein
VNKEWSELNKTMQAQLRKKDSYKAGLETLFSLRNQLMDTVLSFRDTLNPADFSAIPFINADGYHSKTVAYSLWHIFRIEDIVAHEMIAANQQILFRQDFQTAMHSPIITTGNELAGDEIAAFSKQLNLRALYRYAQEVAQSTDRILTSLAYSDLKRTFGEDVIEKLRNTHCVSDAESAAWLIAYWCGKDVQGLIRMPFSRHWIMHVEAMQRIKNRLCKLARKGVDPIAYCGFSCNHCFLSEWCGSCRTAYNTCSFATVSPDGKCPNAVCCQEKGIDGCFECGLLESCEKGFYTPANDGANAAKAQAMYIRKHGKKAFLKAQARLHEKVDFAKTQEILGQDWQEGLRILEAC